MNIKNFLPLKKQPRTGIILVEVLLAVLVLSIGISLILRSLVFSIKATEFSKEYLDIHNLLYEKLMVYKAEAVPQVGTFKGNFSPPYQKVSWQIDIQDTFKETNDNSSHAEELDPLEETVSDVEDEIKIHLITFNITADWKSKNTPHNLTYSTAITIVENTESIQSDDEAELENRSSEDEDED